MNPEMVVEKETLETLLKQNNELQKETVELLRRQEKRAVRSFWFRIIWYTILLGLPFILIPYMIASITTSIGLPSDGTSSGITDAFKNTQEVLKMLQNQ